MSTTTTTARPAEVLLVDDSDADAMLTRESFRLAGLAANVHHVTNGAQCLAFLRHGAEYAEAPAPDLILLDLNMPVMDGREVLRAIVGDDALRHLPVVILTTSADDRDVLSMYRMRCNAYLTKPIDLDRFHEMVRTLGAYWFGAVALPSGG